MKNIHNPIHFVHALLPFFMVGLILKPLFGSGSRFSQFFPALSVWIERVFQGVQKGYGQYPFLAYGTDWMAFGHVAIALAFIGPLCDPTRNPWVVGFDMLVGLS